MSLKSIPWFVWLIPAALLLIALARLPYGYYTFLRVVVCAVALLIAYTGWKSKTSAQVWSVLFALIAILFNPLFPVHLNRAAWFYLDIASAAVFAVHLLLVRLRQPTEQARAEPNSRLGV